jgi:hypothetical protein
MPLPFPGMNPYLEDPAIWSDYHTTFLLHLRSEISRRLPARYVARLDRYVWIRHRYVKIVDGMGKHVITVIEVLSPSNKMPGDDRDAYLAKRGEYLAGGASFIEINLLRGGKQSPMGKPLPPRSDYSVVVSQAAEFPRAGIWPIGLRDRLPSIPVPLAAGERPLKVDLQVCHDLACRDGQYDRDIDYLAAPPLPPLNRTDEAWLRDVLKQKM